MRELRTIKFIQVGGFNKMISLLVLFWIFGGRQLGYLLWNTKAPSSYVYLFHKVPSSQRRQAIIIYLISHNLITKA